MTHRLALVPPEFLLNVCLEGVFFKQRWLLQKRLSVVSCKPEDFIVQNEPLVLPFFEEGNCTILCKCPPLGLFGVTMPERTTITPLHVLAENFGTSLPIPAVAESPQVLANVVIFEQIIALIILSTLPSFFRYEQRVSEQQRPCIRVISASAYHMSQSRESRYAFDLADVGVQP